MDNLSEAPTAQWSKRYEQEDTRIWGSLSTARDSSESGSNPKKHRTAETAGGQLWSSCLLLLGTFYVMIHGCSRLTTYFTWSETKCYIVTQKQQYCEFLPSYQLTKSMCSILQAKGVVDAVLPKGSGNKIQPADIKRQKEIFSPTPPSPQRKRKQYLRDQVTTSPRKPPLD